MGFLNSIKMYARYAAGLPHFLRNPISLADAEELIRLGMEQREENFLRLMQRGVLGFPLSPFARMLRLARCEMGDLRNMLRDHGLTGTLRSLHDAGVYVTFEEFKGRQPIVRHGESFEVSVADFNNPFLRKSYQAESGGSTGAGSRIGHDLEHLAIQSAHLMLLFDAHKALDMPLGVWRGVLPDGSGLNNMLRGARHGRTPSKWFSPNQAGEKKPEMRFQVGTYGTVLVSHLAGRPLPWPQMVPIDQAITVARWMADAIQSHGSCMLSAPVSRALRVCIAAKEAGLDLTGAVFQIAGEPPSPAKVAGITATGARCFTTYGFAEGGRVAIGCVNPISSNDLHILKDAFEVIPFERQVPGAERVVSALGITSLLLTAPQILLNSEMDDYGVVEERSCGCPLERLGYHQHVRDIHSYRKLTGEGVTLVGSDMIDVLERVLPSRFGGSPLDYQLMEEEDEQGFTRMSLIVSPKIEVANEDEIVEAILAELEASSIMAGRAKAIWAQAGTLKIKRQEPTWTGRGKLMPLHLIRQRSGKVSE